MERFIGVDKRNKKKLEKGEKGDSLYSLEKKGESTLTGEGKEGTTLKRGESTREKDTIER